MAVDQEGELMGLLGILALRLRANGVEPASQLGLATLDLALLRKVVFDGPITPKHLAADLSLPAPTVTAVLDRLEARSLIDRRTNPRDRRSLLLQATPAAYPALRRSVTGFASPARTMVEALSDSEQNALTALLRRAIEALVGQQAFSAWSRTEVTVVRPREVQQPAVHQLTGREREVLALIAEGLSSKEIASELFISPRTADSHRYRLMAKTGIHKASGLVRFAIREGLVNP